MSTTALNIDHALSQLVASLNVGLTPPIAPITSIDDWYGEGAEAYLRNLAHHFGDQCAFYEHDEPQCSLQGFRLLYATSRGWEAEHATVDGQQVVALWTTGGYIDSCALFVFGTGAGVRRPALKYTMGDAVTGYYST